MLKAPIIVQNFQKMPSKPLGKLETILNLTAMSVKEEKLSLWQIFKRAFFVFGIVAVILTTFYSIALSPRSTFSDRLSLSSVCICFSFLLIQTFILWGQRKNLLSILVNMDSIYNIFCEQKTFQRYSIDFYQEPSRILEKMAK